MVDFIDETAEKEGTPLNRKNLMAVQGFIETTTIIKSDGSIVETNPEGYTLITRFNSDGSITETFVGEKIITKTTKFESDGTIKEVLS